MHVLLLVTGLPDENSPARSVFNLIFAKELSKKVNSVSVFYFRSIHPRKPFLSKKVINEVTYYEIRCIVPKFSFMKNPLFSNFIFKFFLKRRILLEIVKKSDIVHAINGHCAIPAYLIFEQLNIPYLIQFIGSDVNRKLKELTDTPDFDEVIKNSNILCFNSQELQDVFEKSVSTCIPKKVIYRGVKLQDFPYTFPEIGAQLRLLFLGGFPNNSNLKGGITLLESIKILKSRQLPGSFKIDIAGPSSLNFISELPDLNTDMIDVNFLGAISHEKARELISKSHIVLIPSVMEGIPNVLYEAMASGNMVIASNVGGIPEFVNNGHTGILVSPEDPFDLADSISHALHNPDKIKFYALAGRKKIENYSYFKFIDSYINSYSKIILERQSS